MKFFKAKRYPKYLADDLSLGQQFLIFGWEVFKIVVLSLAIIIPVRYYLIKPFYVKGASMEPNFHDYEYLIIDEISYRFNQPQRGEVVVFRYPLEPRQFFIKRVIGLPGETVTIQDGQITIINEPNPEGLILHEPYLPAFTATGGSVTVTLGSDEYYLLGDNRTSSLDSRIFGPVKEELIVGRVFLRGWPINRAGVLLGEINYNL